mmetsp:Transcript_644/g.1524  ORF Transcript_644/g.1524 Transcript_644/m.1524 type:complete len:100 (+) Transcript_644:1457-1756(+)
MTNFAAAKFDAHKAQRTTITALHAIGSNQFCSDGGSGDGGSAESCVWADRGSVDVSLPSNIGESRLFNDDLVASSSSAVVDLREIDAGFDDIVERRGEP